MGRNRKMVKRQVNNIKSIDLNNLVQLYIGQTTL